MRWRRHKPYEAKGPLELTSGLFWINPGDYLFRHPDTSGLSAQYDRA
jgi:hypothetical protein